MTAPDHVIKGLEALQEKLAQREEAVREAKRRINQYCEMFDLEPLYTDVDDGARAEASRAGTYRPDEFADHKSPARPFASSSRCAARSAGRSRSRRPTASSSCTATRSTIARATSAFSVA